MVWEKLLLEQYYPWQDSYVVDKNMCWSFANASQITKLDESQWNVTIRISRLYTTHVVYKLTHTFSEKIFPWYYITCLKVNWIASCFFCSKWSIKSTMAWWARSNSSCREISFSFCSEKLTYWSRAFLFTWLYFFSSLLHWWSFFHNCIKYML